VGVACRRYRDGGVVSQINDGQSERRQEGKNTILLRSVGQLVPGGGMVGCVQERREQVERGRHSERGADRARRKARLP